MEMIEQELRAYLAEAEHLSNQDRFTHLMAIFQKHMTMEKTEHLMGVYDMRMIVDMAKSAYPGVTLPMQISKKEVYPSEVPHVLMIEAVIGYLTKNKLLKKIVNFNYGK